MPDEPQERIVTYTPEQEKEMEKHGQDFVKALNDSVRQEQTDSD